MDRLEKSAAAGRWQTENTQSTVTAIFRRSRTRIRYTLYNKIHSLRRVQVADDISKRREPDHAETCGFARNNSLSRPSYKEVASETKSAMERNRWEIAIRCLEIALHPNTSDEEVIAAVNGFRRTAEGTPLRELCRTLAAPASTPRLKIAVPPARTARGKPSWNVSTAKISNFGASSRSRKATRSPLGGKSASSARNSGPRNAAPRKPNGPRPPAHNRFRRCWRPRGAAIQPGRPPRTLPA